jgi:hypothetical protein
MYFAVNGTGAKTDPQDSIHARMERIPQLSAGCE